MSQMITDHISALDAMKKYPNELFYKGNLALLDRPKVSIVGSRNTSLYTQDFTYSLAQAVIYNNKWYSTKINGTIGYANVL